MRRAFESRQRKFLDEPTRVEQTSELNYGVHGSFFGVYGFLHQKCKDVTRGVWILLRDVWVS